MAAERCLKIGPYGEALELRCEVGDPGLKVWLGGRVFTLLADDLRKVRDFCDKVIESDGSDKCANCARPLGCSGIFNEADGLTMCPRCRNWRAAA